MTGETSQRSAWSSFSSDAEFRCSKKTHRFMRDPLSESSTKRRFAIVSSDCVGWHRSSSPVTMQLLARISTASSQAGVGARSGIFGYTTEEAIGQPITMIIPKDRHLARRARTRRFGWVCRSPALSEASKSRLPSKEPL